MELIPYSELKRKYMNQYAKFHYKRVFQFNNILKKEGIVYSGGLSDIEHKVYTLHGFSEKISDIVQAINHEVNHILTEQLLNEAGISLYDYNVSEIERVNKLISKNNLKIWEKMSFFAYRFCREKIKGGLFW